MSVVGWRMMILRIGSKLVARPVHGYSVGGSLTPIHTQGRERFPSGHPAFDLGFRIRGSSLFHCIKPTGKGMGLAFYR